MEEEKKTIKEEMSLILLSAAFFTVRTSVFSCICINTKSSLEKLSSNFLVELKHICMYYRNTSVFSEAG